MKKPSVYFIPDNIIGEGRIGNGLFKTRNFAEGTVLSFSAGILIWNLPLKSFDLRLSLLISFCVPLLFLGIQGVGGDPFFSWLFHVICYYKEKGVRLYNDHIDESLYVKEEQEIFKPQAAQALLLRYKEKTGRNDPPRSFVEGEDFTFIEDSLAKKLGDKQKKASQEKLFQTGFSDSLPCDAHFADWDQETKQNAVFETDIHI